MKQILKEIYYAQSSVNASRIFRSKTPLIFDAIFVRGGHEINGSS
jgi:hypothetical protein